MRGSVTLIRRWLFSRKKPKGYEYREPGCSMVITKADGSKPPGMTLATFLMMSREHEILTVDQEKEFLGCIERAYTEYQEKEG